MRGEPDPGIAAGDRGGGGEIAACAVTGDADARGIATELGNAGDDILRRREGVLERTGEAHLGWAAIIN